MAKKDLLGSFKFEKLDGLTNGIDMPLSNSLKESKMKMIDEPVNQIGILSQNKVKNKTSKTKKDLKISQVSLPRNFNFKGKAVVEPMVNVMPTSQEVVHTKPKIATTNQESRDIVPKLIRLKGHFDATEYGACLNKQDRILYLAKKGWTLKVETRRNDMFHYATKYINRKKERVYVGSINETQ